jgi:hypothetical protein
VFVLAVGQQDRVGERPWLLSDDSSDVREPGAHCRPAFGPKAVDGARRRRPGCCAGLREPSLCGVDLGGRAGACDDREVGAVDEFVDGGRGSAFRRVELGGR